MTEGIFRLSGQFSQVESIKKAFDKGYLPFFEVVVILLKYLAGKEINFDEDTDPHLVGGVLKSWLCEMERPLLTYELFDCFIAATKCLLFNFY